MSKRKQSGVAIVLAMGVVALAALAAAALLRSQSTWLRHAELGAEHAQAQAFVPAGVDWARAMLSDDRRMSSVDHLGEAWALRQPPIPLDNGELSSHIDDQQAAFNLNNLARGGVASQPQLAQFRRLLHILALPEALADPSIAAHLPLIDAAELVLIPGFDQGVRDRLGPFVTALPRFTAVNVNTAPPEVLAALIEGVDLDAARELVAQRSRAYFRDRAEFVARLPAGGVVAAASDIATSSDFFQASVRVTIGDAAAHGTALLARGPTGWPEVVWRKYP
jgi:general secretion pathway protein K